MMRLTIGAVLVLVAACAAPARTEAPAEPPSLTTSIFVPDGSRASTAPRVRSAVACDIRATRTARGLRLEAIAHAERAVRGLYDFVITAQGSGGSSDVTQGGPFDLTAGRSATVGAAEISRGRYRAVLTLGDADGEFCRSERRS